MPNLDPGGLWLYVDGRGFRERARCWYENAWLNGACGRMLVNISSKVDNLEIVGVKRFPHADF